MRLGAFRGRSSGNGLVCARSVNATAGDALVRIRRRRNICTGGYKVVVFSFVVGLHCGSDALALAALETAHLSATAWDSSQMHATQVMSDGENVKSVLCARIIVVQMDRSERGQTRLVLLMCLCFFIFTHTCRCCAPSSDERGGVSIWGNPGQ